MKNSQLHDQIVMGPTLIELLHPHNVLVLDSVKKRADFTARLIEA